MGTLTITKSSPNQIWFATSMIMLSCICFGTVPFFARNLSLLDVPSLAIPFYRYSLTALVLLPVLYQARAQRTALLWSIFSGICMGLGWVCYVEALELVSVATAGVVYMTYPAFTLFLAWLWFSEKPHVKSIIAAIIVLVAAALCMTNENIDSTAIAALTLSFITPLTFAISILVLIYKLESIKPLARLASLAAGAVIGITPLMLSLDPRLLIPDTPKVIYLAIGLALVTALIPQLLYCVFASRIGAAKCAMAGSFELPTMFIIGWFAFGEHLGTLELISGALVIIAIFMTPAKTNN